MGHDPEAENHYSKASQGSSLQNSNEDAWGSALTT